MSGDPMLRHDPGHVPEPPLLTVVSPGAEMQLGDAVVAIDFSPGGRLAVLTADGRVVVDAAQRSSSPVGGAVRSLAWADDGLLAVADHRLGVVLAGGGEPAAHPLHRARVVRGRPGRIVAIGGADVWVLDRSGEAVVVPGRCGELRDLAFVTPSLVAAVGSTGVALIDVALGVVDTRVELDAPLSVCADPTGEMLAVGDLGGSIHVVRVGDETDGRELTGYPDRVRHLAWADHGRWLLAASDDELTCWEMVGEPDDRWPADEPISCLGHDEPITALAATPNGDLAATGDASGRVAVWSLRAPHRPVAMVEIGAGTDGGELSGAVGAVAVVGPREVTALVWSSGGIRLAAGDVNGSVQVWAVERGQVA